MLRIAVSFCLLALSAACADLPRVELQAYRDSFQAARTAATPMIDDYAAAERAERLAALKAATVDPAGQIPRFTDQAPYFATFEVADTAAASTIGLPPGADAVDRSFRGIEGYNETLVSLAENRNIDEAQAQLSSIVSDVGGIVPIGPTGQAVAQGVVGLVRTVLEPAIAAGNRELFRRIVIDGYEPAAALIDLLIAHSPDQYATTISPLLERIENGASNRAELVDKINAWHQIFADYVVLLQALKARLGELKDAVENPQSVPALARASAGAAQLRGYADNLRRSITDLRAMP